MFSVEEIKTIEDRVKWLMLLIQREQKFKNSEHELAGHVYFNFSKTKRIYETINIILDSALKNSYLETLPLCRSLFENYFHLLYVTKNKDDSQRIKTEYDNLRQWQLWNLGKHYQKLKQIKTNIHHEYNEHIKKYFDGKSPPEVPNHIKYISSLAEEVGRYDFYVELYTILSSHVHFNPVTEGNYGSMSGDVMVYNRIEYDEHVDALVRYHIVRVMLLLIQATIKFFGLKDFEEKQFNPVASHFKKLQESM